MGSKTLDLLDGKSACSSNDPKELRTCADLSKPDAKVSIIQRPESADTMRILAGFSVGEQARDAGITTVASTASFALAGAGYRSVAITGEKFGAVLAEAPIKIIGTMLGMDPNGVGLEASQKVLAEPYGPRVLKSGLRMGKWGALAGIAAYGLYEGYQYLTTDNTNS